MYYVYRVSQKKLLTKLWAKILTKIRCCGAKFCQGLHLGALDPASLSEKSQKIRFVTGSFEDRYNLVQGSLQNLQNLKRNDPNGCIFRLFPPDYPKDGPNGRSPYLSSCKLHGGHHDHHDHHHDHVDHHGKHGGHRQGEDLEKNPFSPLDSPHAPPSGSLPASPVGNQVFSFRTNLINITDQ